MTQGWLALALFCVGTYLLGRVLVGVVILKLARVALYRRTGFYTYR